MHPHLFHLGPVTVHTYGVMLMLSFLVATWLAARASRSWPAGEPALSAEHTTDLVCTALLGGIVGARVLYVILHWEAYASSPHDVVAIWRGGLVWYGGFLGGALAAWLYIRIKRLAFLRAADQIVPFLALGHAIGRVGCFLNGCCYGKPTTAWCGIVFPGTTVAVLPTQLFESLGLLIVYLALRQQQRPEILRHPGRLFGSYLVAYAALRFAIEFLRGDQTVLWAGLTLQQLISVGIGIGGAVILGASVRRTPSGSPRT